MSATNSAITTLAKVQSPFSAWLDRNKGKLTGGILIMLVVGYVAFLIITPITALAFGAFEKGFGGILSSLNDPDIFRAFSNTLWISLVVVIIHTIFGTL